METKNKKETLSDTVSRKLEDMITTQMKAGDRLPHGDGIGGNVFRGQVNHSGKPESPVIQGTDCKEKRRDICVRPREGLSDCTSGPADYHGYRADQ